MGKLYCQSIRRTVSDAEMLVSIANNTITMIFVFIIKASIKKVLGTSAGVTKINKCLQWCKKKIRTYRVEERRKVYLKLKVIIYNTLKPGAGNKST